MKCNSKTKVSTTMVMPLILKAIGSKHCKSVPLIRKLVSIYTFFYIVSAKLIVYYTMVLFRKGTHMRQCEETTFPTIQKMCN